MPIKGQSPKEIVHTELRKFKHGTLHSGSKHGPLVKSRKQAIAIALSESGQSKYQSGGDIKPIPVNPMNETADPSVIAMGTASGTPMRATPPGFSDKAAARAALNLSTRLIDKHFAKDQAHWTENGPALTPAERVELANAFKQKQAAQQYLDSTQAIDLGGEFQSGGLIPVRMPNTLNAMMQGVEQDPLNPHAQLGMLAPYAIPGAPMPSARLKRPVHIDEKSEKEKDKGYAKGGLTFNQRWRDVPIQAEDFGDRFFPGFVGQTHGEASPLYTPLKRRAEEIGQQQAPATFEARWPSKPFGTFPLYSQASPYAVGGPIGNQRAPQSDRNTPPPDDMDLDPNISGLRSEDRNRIHPDNVQEPPTMRRFQMGGFNPEKAMSIGLSRRASQGSGGLLKSQIPGRTDQIQASIPKGAYIIPADVVSGMGQGNTDAGGAILGKLMNRGPFGMNLPKRTAGSRVGSRHSSLKFSKKLSHRGGRYADGGDVGDPEPVLAAGGEYVVLPHEVAALGAGDVDTGHNILDAFVKHMREKTISTMRKLPGPKGAKK